MLSGGVAAGVVVPVTALCAGTFVPELVELLASLATGAAGAAATLPEDEVEDAAAEAEAEIAGSPEAIMVTPGPAGAAGEPARRPAVVRVAESTLTVELLEDEATACCAPGGAGPATTVTADVTVCIVLLPGPGPMAPSWKG